MRLCADPDGLSGQDVVQGVFYFMDYIDKVLEKLKDWGRRIVDALLGPEVEPEHELIPIPVDDRRYR